MNYYIGIDNGGTVVKASIFDQNGTELASASQTVKLAIPQPGWAQRDAGELYQANCEVCRKIITDSRIDPAAISAVCVTGHGKGLYLCDAQGRPTAPGILSTDTRALAICQRWKADGTEQKAFRISHQSILCSQPACLLTWLKENCPEVLARTRYVFECKDYIRYCLTGSARAEYSEISSSNVICLDTKQYDLRLFRLFGIEDCRDKFPDLCGSTEIAGRITQEAARLTGIPAGTPVVGGTMDIIASALGLGVTDDRYLCSVAGTWCINLYMSRNQILDGSVMINSSSAVEGLYIIEESSPTGTVNMNWLIRNLLPEVQKNLPAGCTDIYAYINREIASVPAEAVNPVFLPFIAASSGHPDASGCFIGIRSDHTRANLLRSVYEGTVFSHRSHIEKLLQARGNNPPAALRAAGGSSHSDIWVQMLADAVQLPVQRTTAREAGTLGCAILAAAGTGAYPDIPDAAAAMTTLLPEVLPDPGRKDLYDQKYALYQCAEKSLYPFWDRLRAMK